MVGIIFQVMLSSFLVPTTASHNVRDSQSDETAGHSMEDLLGPMRSLQLFIRLDKRYYSPTEAQELAMPLQRALQLRGQTG